MIFISAILGLLAGTLTGLIPGLHINLVSIFVLSLFSNFDFISAEDAFIFIVSMGITHTFLDFIPSTFIGVPSEDTIMSIMPAHKMVIEGDGQRAIFLALIGSLFSFLICLLLVPVFLILFPLIASFLEGNIGIALLFVILLLFFIEGKNGKLRLSFIIFSLSGILGYFVLNSRMDEPLFPMLSGLFGLSMIICSLKQKSYIPKQKQCSFIEICKEKIHKSHLFAVLGGGITGFLPGIGSSQAAVIGGLFQKDSDHESFIVMNGGINTVNFFVSMITLFTIGKARNGALVVAKEIMKNFEFDFLVIVLICLIFVSLSATLIGIFFSRKLSLNIAKFDYGLILKIILILIILATVLLSGFYGIIVLGLATIIGIIAIRLNVPKHNCMACILVPVLLWTI